MSREKQKEFRVKKSIRDQLRARKRRLTRRLDKTNYPQDLTLPMLRGAGRPADSRPHDRRRLLPAV
jgi:hypothetical protein